MATALSGLVLTYCFYLILFRRRELSRDRRFRLLNLLLGPLIYATVVLITSAETAIPADSIAVASLFGSLLGAWRARAIKLICHVDGSIFQRSNWTSLIPIMLLVSIWPIERVVGRGLSTSGLQLFSNMLLWGLVASSVAFSVIQMLRYARFEHSCSPTQTP